MKPQLPDFTLARTLFEQGYSPRMIARRTDILPSLIKAQAIAQHWQPGPALDWTQLRHQFERGMDLVEIAQTCIVSLSTLRKRSRREKWSRNVTSGLDALRKSVQALELALAAAPADDPILTTRISTALSMAAGRLSRAETGGKGSDLADEPETQTDPEEEESRFELTRLLQDWRRDDEDHS